MNKNNDIVIYDTTQREGIQRRGTGGTEAIRAAVSLLTAQFLKTGVIELGMPANPVDKSLMGRIIHEFQENPAVDPDKIAIAFLCRVTDFDIEEGANFFTSYPNNIMHLFIGTSKEHRETRFKGGKDLKAYCELIREKVAYAASKKSVARIMFSPEDTTRTYREGEEVLFEILDAVLSGYEEGNKNAGRKTAPIINIADTLGCGSIAEFAGLIRNVKEHYKDRLELSVHMHNDMDMATANTYEAYLLGVKYLQVCWNGSGERNGLAKLEPLIAKLVIDGYITNEDFLATENLSKMTLISKTIAHLYGWQIDENLPVTGPNANLSTAGIHTNLTSKNIRTYHISGERFGNPVGMSFCSTSGSSHLKNILDESGFAFTEDHNALLDCTNFLKNLANERQSDISESECIYHAERIINKKKETNPLAINDFTLNTHRNERNTTIHVDGSYHDKKFSHKASGVGPVDATKNAMMQIIGEDTANITLVDFITKVKVPIDAASIDYNNLTDIVGTDASLYCECAFHYRGRYFYGTSIDSNSSLAECEAIINAFKKMVQISEWEKLS